MEASQAAHGGRPSRGAISCTRCAFVMAVRPRSAAGGSRAQRPRWRPRARCREPRAQRRSCPCPRGRRVCRPTMARRWQGLENLGDRPQAESPAARSQSLPEEQKARSCAASASCRWGGGSFDLRGGGAPAALAPFSPRYSIGMAREAVRASESLVQARLPRSWTTIVLAQQRRPMGRTASRASDAIERPMPTQSRQMPMSLRRVGTGWRAGWMQSADRWRESGRKPAERRQEQPPRCHRRSACPWRDMAEPWRRAVPRSGVRPSRWRGRGWPRSAWDGPKLACSPGLYADGRSNVGNGALRGRLRRRKWRSWALAKGLKRRETPAITCEYSERT